MICTIFLLLTNLENNNAKQHSHGNRDIFSDENHAAASDLQHHVDDHKQVAQKLQKIERKRKKPQQNKKQRSSPGDKRCRQATHFSTPPREVDVVFLLRPLEPHAQAVFQKCGDEAQASQMRQVVLRVAEKTVRQIVGFGDQPFVRVAASSRHLSSPDSRSLPLATTHRSFCALPHNVRDERVSVPLRAVAVWECKTGVGGAKVKVRVADVPSGKRGPGV